MNFIILLSYAFGFSELILFLVKRSSRRTSTTRGNRGSLILLWLTITMGITGGFFLSRPISQFWMGFGLPLLIAGLIIRWIAILQLGRSFTVDVAINEKARLKTDGIYGRVRHPSYLGLLTIVIGFSSMMSSLYSFLVLVIPVLIAILYRISVEEKLLIREYGNSYIEYMKTSRKIIPGIY
jgi:protein-S-isoprenylcysteine O-methyltransferase Ste14